MDRGMEGHHSGYSESLGLGGEHIRALRTDLFEKLGLVTLAEKHLPEVITEGLYDKTLDQYRQVVERGLNDTTS